MTTIILHTEIKAPILRVFDLARDIDFHQHAASQTKEKAIGGITSGIIELDQKVKWKGKHFGLWLTHESLITECIAPSSFTDTMTRGIFKSFEHLHLFTEMDGVTTMKDTLIYQTPYGPLGNLFDYLTLKKHLVHFLKTRNATLKKTLENNQ